MDVNWSKVEDEFPGLDRSKVTLILRERFMKLSAEERKEYHAMAVSRTRRFNELHSTLQEERGDGSNNGSSVSSDGSNGSHVGSNGSDGSDVSGVSYSPQPRRNRNNKNNR